MRQDLPDVRGGDVRRALGHPAPDEPGDPAFEDTMAVLQINKSVKCTGRCSLRVGRLHLRDYCVAYPRLEVNGILDVVNGIADGAVDGLFLQDDAQIRRQGIYLILSSAHKN